ncbi:hypothetical protein G7Y89_g4843 [Cudoniella acicularis]|uniref:Uncharacterized protein n=1 Tax=Cudoniella acicularis TaxID=354080 RepID=A0A8H4W3X2_9HELO|nr:hypothetical protein G7Y89_g4843 [Cudoniella acicularis]
MSNNNNNDRVYTRPYQKDGAFVQDQNVNLKKAEMKASALRVPAPLQNHRALMSSADLNSLDWDEVVKDHIYNLNRNGVEVVQLVLVSTKWLAEHGFIERLNERLEAKELLIELSDISHEVLKGFGCDASDEARDMRYHQSASMSFGASSNMEITRLQLNYSDINKSIEASLGRAGPLHVDPHDDPTLKSLLFNFSNILETHYPGRFNLPTTRLSAQLNPMEILIFSALRVFTDRTYYEFLMRLYIRDEKEIKARTPEFRQIEADLSRELQGNGQAHLRMARQTIVREPPRAKPDYVKRKKDLEKSGCSVEEQLEEMWANEGEGDDDEDDDDDDEAEQKPAKKRKTG